MVTDPLPVPSPTVAPPPAKLSPELMMAVPPLSMVPELGTTGFVLQLAGFDQLPKAPNPSLGRSQRCGSHEDRGNGKSHQMSD